MKRLQSIDQFPVFHLSPPVKRTLKKVKKLDGAGTKNCDILSTHKIFGKCDEKHTINISNNIETSSLLNKNDVASGELINNLEIRLNVHYFNNYHHNTSVKHNKKGEKYKSNSTIEHDFNFNKNALKHDKNNQETGENSQFSSSFYKIEFTSAYKYISRNKENKQTNLKNDEQNKHKNNAFSNETYFEFCNSKEDSSNTITKHRKNNEHSFNPPGFSTPINPSFLSQKYEFEKEIDKNPTHCTENNFFCEKDETNSSNKHISKEKIDKLNVSFQKQRKEKINLDVSNNIRIHVEKNKKRNFYEAEIHALEKPSEISDHKLEKTHKRLKESNLNGDEFHNVTHDQKAQHKKDKKKRSLSPSKLNNYECNEKEERDNSESMLFNEPVINVGNKHKRKHKKDKNLNPSKKCKYESNTSETDIETDTLECILFSDPVINVDSKHMKKHKKAKNLNPSKECNSESNTSEADTETDILECVLFSDPEINVSNKHKKKHKNFNPLKKCKYESKSGEVDAEVNSTLSSSLIHRLEEHIIQINSYPFKENSLEQHIKKINFYAAKGNGYQVNFNGKHRKKQKKCNLNIIESFDNFKESEKVKINVENIDNSAVSDYEEIEEDIEQISTDDESCNSTFGRSPKKQKNKPIIDKNNSYSRTYNDINREEAQAASEHRNKNCEKHLISDIADKCTFPRKYQEKMFNSGLSNVNVTEVSILNEAPKDHSVSVVQNFALSLNGKHIDKNELHKEKINDISTDENCNLESKKNRESNFTSNAVVGHMRNKKKHKKDKKLNCDLISDCPDSSELNIIHKNSKEYSDSLVVNDLEIFGTEFSNKCAIVKKKQKKENNNLNLDKVCEEDTPTLSSDINSTVVFTDAELNFSENADKYLPENELHISLVKSSRKDKKIKAVCNTSLKDNSCFEPILTNHSDISKNTSKKSASLNASNDKSHYDSSMNETVNCRANSRACMKNLDESFTGFFGENINTQLEVLKLEEDPVDFEIPLLHKFEKVSSLNQIEINNLLAAGISIKRGKYTDTEDDIIKRNFVDFVRKYEIREPVELLGIGKCRRSHNRLLFLKAKHFYVRLGKGLNDRELSSIYRRARLILDPQGTASNFTEGAAHRKNVYKWPEKNISRGKFTKTERMLLRSAIQKVTGKSDLTCKNMKNVSWEKVASYVPTRNYVQCRQYWADYLAWKKGSQKKKWNRECYRELICILKEMDIKNPSMINWYKIYKEFTDFAPSHIFIQKKWLYLRSQITDYRNKSHSEIIELLCDKYEIVTKN